jgi:alcohol dehydrogenase class IV
MTPFELRLRHGFVFGCGALEQVGTLAQELDFRRTLLVADQGLVEAGHVAQVRSSAAARSSGPLPTVSTPIRIPT